MRYAFEYDSLFSKVQALQDILVQRACGDEARNVVDYEALRADLTQEPTVRALIPDFVRRCRDLGQFWHFIKGNDASIDVAKGIWAARRSFLWGAFRPALEATETGIVAPVDQSVADALGSVDSDEAVRRIWHRAIERRATDPEGAITLARTLLEQVCKHILTDLSIPYAKGVELPDLYKQVQRSLRLAPSAHSEQAIKQTLQGCTSVVHGLGSFRNKEGDAHGKAPKAPRPAPRHAELAVNLGGAMAVFLVQTWKFRKERSP